MGLYRNLERRRAHDRQQAGRAGEEVLKKGYTPFETEGWPERASSPLPEPPP